MSQARPRSDIQKVFQASSMIPNRLIHLIPDDLAAEVPNHILFSYPRTKDLQDGFVDITAKCFANAINRGCWYLESLLGKAQSFETIGYMGTNDIRYFILMFAAIKARYKMLFVSPRNNLEGHLNVLEGSSCHIFLSSRGTRVGHILESRPMRAGFVPELEELLEDVPVPGYPYTKTFDEAHNDPCLVLHTTGSTGLPKPITWKIGILSTYEAWRTIPHVDGYVPTTEIYQQARRVYTSMPLFHTSGLNSAITWALLLGVTLVYGHPDVVPNSAYTDDMHKYANVDASLGAPSLYEELSQDRESLKRISRLQYIVASGAPLSNAAGNLISQHTRVISNLGSTETACLQRLAPSVEDWAYFYWHPTHSGIEMRKYEDDLYELFLVRDPKLARYQGIFSTFRGIQEWSMSDLYSRHPDPSKPFLYRYKGRRDDVIVLSNGEKLSPALMEATLQSSPLVKGAMIVGRGKFQPAALLDLGQAPPATTAERHALLRSLLPVIAEANQHAPAHGQLDQHHVLFSDPTRPVHYLGQGKIQRHRTYAYYEADIEALYEGAEDGVGGFDVSSKKDGTDAITTSDIVALPPVDFSCHPSIRQWLGALVGEISGVRSLRGSDVFFRHGLDSLHVIRIARELRLRIQRGADTVLLPPSFPAGSYRPNAARLARKDVISPKLVYANPTLDQLAAAVYEITGAAGDLDSGYATEEQAQGGTSTGTSDDGSVMGENDGGASDSEEEDGDAGRVERMQSLLDKYAKTLPGLESRRRHNAQAAASVDTDDRDNSDNSEGGERSVVLLTGSTGSLGSYILDELYNDADVAQIVCLDRSADAAARHACAGPRRGLSPLDDRDRVEFLQADLSKPQLGLADEVYAWLRRSVTHIIHNQWPVNFHWPLSLFEPYVAGVRNLACLAAESDRDAFVLFVSSVSSVGEWKKSSSAPSSALPSAIIAKDGKEDEQHTAVPEAPITDLRAAARMGYGESKLVSECLLDRAATISGVRSACCRVGIVAGPVERRQGLWSKHEYIPSIMVSSPALGVYPSTFPARERVDWIPVDKLSKVLIEILRSASSSPSAPLTSTCYHDSDSDSDSEGEEISPARTLPLRRTQTFHVVHPRATSWAADVAPALATAYAHLSTHPPSAHNVHPVRRFDRNNEGEGVESPRILPVPFETWLCRLRKRADAAEHSGRWADEVAYVPALRLLDFYTSTSASAFAPSAAFTARKGRGASPDCDGDARYLPSKRSEHASPTLRALAPLDGVWLGNWMAQWGMSVSG
ncbi:putative NRPS-like enzyme [Durotheca rogersii]|uniref:putative NRPS-like enzyme n=1 Tax=Durotheca rogersii TaxID=419775 RepID=UPI00221F1F3E|nr:putative NRPS-like enzyme [Durotheca rogersii]KAI5860467.1 putative NRPS-like enzyme [Durotheca rogersii]